MVWEEVMGLTSWQGVKQGAGVVRCELDPWSREDGREPGRLQRAEEA